MTESSSAGNPRLSWFAFYPTDWSMDEHVMLMTMEERGVYITLLCYAWQNGGLPTECDRIARALQMDAEQVQRMFDGPLGQCWVEVNGRLVNPRMQREADVAKTRSAKSRAAAQARWAKKKEAASESPAMPTHSAGTAPAMPLQYSTVQDTSSPLTPPAGGTRKRKSHKRTTWSEVQVAAEQSLVGAQGLAALQAWFEYKAERNQRLVLSTWKRLIREAGEDPTAFAAKVENSIASGYTGLFAPQQAGGRGPQPKLNSVQSQQLNWQAALDRARSEEETELDKMRGLLESDGNTDPPSVFDV